MFVKEFHILGRFCQRCNVSFVMLIPYVNNPTMIKDYSHISLIGLQYKTIPKLLANTLAKVNDDIVSPMKYEFVKDR